jgi:hypothetical protein
MVIDRNRQRLSPRFISGGFSFYRRVPALIVAQLQHQEPVNSVCSQRKKEGAAAWLRP